MINNKYLLSLFITSLSITLLYGCGGGGGTTSSTDNTPSQPHQLTARNLQGLDVLSRDPFPAPTVTTDGKTITISSTSVILPDEHHQFFLNIDNNAATGYRFDNQAWDDAGADYIVEDGYLFKSIANDSSWSWDTDVGEVSYTKTPSTVSVTIDKSLLQGLTPQIRIGYAKRAKNWDGISIWPRASLMALYSIDVPPPPIDNIPPVITLNGSQTLSIQKDSTFIDPGASAIDNIDGDLSTAMQTISNLDVGKEGTYQIKYSVTDAAGNQASIARTIIVTTNSVDNILIDGQILDWENIPVFAQSKGATLKVTDSSEKIYILVNANKPLTNTQLFLDVDNDSTTGFQFTGTVWNQGGADYMIENEHLDKNRNGTSSWAWNYRVGNIDFVKNVNIIEVAIPKRELQSLGDILNLGFVNRDDSWQVESVLPESGMLAYELIRQQAELALLPNFCGRLWETNGTPEFTRISPFNSKNSNDDVIIKHNGDWYGVYESIDGNTGGSAIDIVRYDGVRNIQFLPLHLVRSEPLGDDKITELKFLGDTLYFIFGNELWVTDGSGGPGTHLVKKFDDYQGSWVAKSLSLINTDNFLLIREVNDHDDSPLLWRLEQDESLTLLSKNASGNMLVHQNEVYFGSLKTDGTQAGTVETGFRPFASHQGKLYYTVQNGSNFDVWALNGTSSTVVATFEKRPSLQSTHGALYLTTRDGPSISLWKIDSLSAEKILLATISSSFNTSVGFSGAYFIAGKDYYASSFLSSRLNSASLKRVEAEAHKVVISGGFRPRDEGAIDTRPQFSFVDGSLYYTAFESNLDATSQFIGIIDNGTGLPKKLASCNLHLLQIPNPVQD